LHVEVHVGAVFDVLRCEEASVGGEVAGPEEVRWHHIVVKSVQALLKLLEHLSTLVLVVIVQLIRLFQL